MSVGDKTYKVLIIMHSSCIGSPWKANIMAINTGFLSYMDLRNTSQIGLITAKHSFY